MRVPKPQRKLQKSQTSSLTYRWVTLFPNMLNSKLKAGQNHTSIFAAFFKIRFIQTFFTPSCLFELSVTQLFSRSVSIFPHSEMIPLQVSQLAPSCRNWAHLRRGSRILVRGPLSPKFAQNRGFPLKLPKNCMILKKSWGKGAGPPGPPPTWIRC